MKNEKRKLKKRYTWVQGYRALGTPSPFTHRHTGPELTPIASHAQTDSLIPEFSPLLNFLSIDTGRSMQGILVNWKLPLLLLSNDVGLVVSKRVA